MSEYNSNSIESLDYFQHIRKYPGMYIGSKSQEGLHHCIKEIISNSIDEWLNGSGNAIIVNVNNEEHYVEVIDNARGIPHGKHKNGMSLLSACFGVANTGGKFNNATGQSGYNTSGGEHGTGGKAVNALSVKTIVTTSREGVKETSVFSRGKLLSETSEKIADDITGTTVKFYPDAEVFETIEVDTNYIENMIREFSYLCKGLTFIFNGKKFKSDSGLYEYLEYLNKGKTPICKPLYFERTEGDYTVEVAFTYNDSYGSNIKLYTNNIPQQKGTHLTGFKTAFTAGMNNFAREKKWLKEKDENLNGSDYEEGLCLILNFRMIDPVFMGQNKEELKSSEGRTYVQKLTSLALKDLFSKNEKDIKTIFEKAISARKARAAAKKARDAVRKPKEKGLKAKVAISSKFIDCVDKNPKNRNLLLVEGLSAGSSAIEARNAKTDCIYMLRGKIISPLKTSVDKILANQEMSDIVSVIGAGFGNENFDLKKMNFDKIVITSDQDSDGAAIELLLITFFYTYMRPLVEAGKLYRAVTPLYIVKTGKEELYFYSDAEMTEWSSEHSGTKYNVLRAKGLGELDATDLHRVCFEKQRYKRITISDAAETTKLLDILEGPAVDPRKKYIYDNAENLGFDFD